MSESYPASRRVRRPASVVSRNPESLRSVLTTVADTAAALTTLLDGLCRQYTREPAIRQEPICVELDQAAAAAADLRAAAEIAAKSATDETGGIVFQLPSQETAP